MKSIQVTATREPDVFCVCAAGEPRGGIFSGHSSRVKLWSSDGVLVHALDAPTPGDVTSICTCPTHVTQFAFSADTSVFYYDQRNVSTPIKQFSFNREEINEICINRKGEFLAACDDSGDIQIIDIENTRVFKTCRGGHDNVCSAIAFHPKRPWELVSGGLDCQLILWDFSRGKPLYKVNMQELASREDSGAYLVNPAMVHSLSCMGGEHTLVCGIGSGGVSVCDVSRKKQLEVLCTTQLHSLAVGSVQCVPKQDAREWWVVSGGNDTKLVLSQLKKQLEEVMTGAGPGGSTGAEQVKLEPVHVLSHGSKINWLSAVPSAVSPETNVVVADQTSNITTFCIQ